jgi:hypothetical protein
MNTLSKLIDSKLNQWDREAAINAARAKAAGIEARTVEYPTGKKMMRFGKPYGKEFGMHYEVTPEVWEAI